MDSTSVRDDRLEPNQTASVQVVPWQIWIVACLLGLEGIGNLFSILDNPIALYWLLAKVLFIAGLLKAWKWIFVIFLVIAGYHCIFFLEINPIASLMNLVLVGLAISARRYYFPRKFVRATHIGDITSSYP
jgi:hypothetical protein